jgi:protein TonB
MDLQSNLIESKKQHQGGRWQASLTSLILHGIFIASIIFLGATASHRVDAEDKIRAFVAQGAAPPPPPPPPPPPAASASTPKPTPHVQQPIPIPHDALIPPREIPKEIPKVDIPMTAKTEDIKPSEDLPSSAPVGGVPGGVAGGVVGGEVGGVIGGTVGGVIGGELGGVLGGKVGGTGTGTEGEGKEAPVAKPEPPPEGPLRVGGDVKAPVVTNRVEPKYTETARTARVSGIVIVEAIIDKSGHVDQVRVVKGLPMGLSEEAERAVRQWHFRPGTLNGQPVDVIFNLTVNFKLTS